MFIEFFKDNIKTRSINNNNKKKKEIALGSSWISFRPDFVILSECCSVFI